MQAAVARVMAAARPDVMKPAGTPAMAAII